MRGNLEDWSEGLNEEISGLLESARQDIGLAITLLKEETEETNEEA